jgi:hypothetical protein
MAKEICCPQCGQSDRVEKVSTVYLVGIGLNRQPVDPASQVEVKFKLADLSQTDLHSLARQLKPPASTRKLPTRPLHPDLIVITFSLIVPIFLFGIWTSQTASLLPVLGFLAVLYALYFWRRKAIVGRFEARQSAQRASDERVRQAIERWMKLYYCARDDVVFEPGKTGLAPASETMAFILREDSSDRLSSDVQRPAG